MFLGSNAFIQLCSQFHSIVYYIPCVQQVVKSKVLFEENGSASGKWRSAKGKPGQS